MQKEDSSNLKTFDFAVANPPFSAKAWTNGFDPANDLYQRFADGIPPTKNGDYAFLLHILRSLKSTGKGAVILPHGVLFRGNVEADIRRNIVRRGYIKGIIGLPANLFYGTGIPACIIVLDKENAVNRTGIFMIDASKGFMKDGNKNRLRHQDIHKIVAVFNQQLEVSKYARLVGHDEIEANDYNLNIPRYIDSTEPEDIQDIEAHLLGGIPNADLDALERYWRVFPAMADELFTPFGREGYSNLKVDMAQIKPAIFDHPEFVAYTREVTTVFDGWIADNTSKLKHIAIGSKPKELIEEVSENLLQAFAPVPLIDKYDVYQHLMTYWTETMQDDVYMIVVDGWKEANKIRLLVKTGKKYTEEADIEIGKQKFKADLIPPQLIIQRYFANEQQTLQELDADLEAITRQMEEMDEEHGGEDGLLSDAKNEKGKLTKANVKNRIKEIKGDADFADEHQALTGYLALIDKEAAAKKQIKAAQEALYEQVIKKYPALSEDEIKTLVVVDKWLAALTADVQSELDRVSQALTGRIKQLAERYATPLPQLTTEVEALSGKVDAHLKRMGFSW
jgi:type I restriction enzyme M protein